MEPFAQGERAAAPRWVVGASTRKKETLGRVDKKMAVAKCQPQERGSGGGLCLAASPSAAHSLRRTRRRPPLPPAPPVTAEGQQQRGSAAAAGWCVYGQDMGRAGRAAPGGSSGAPPHRGASSGMWQSGKGKRRGGRPAPRLLRRPTGVGVFMWDHQGARRDWPQVCPIFVHESLPHEDTARGSFHNGKAALFSTTCSHVAQQRLW